MFLYVTNGITCCFHLNLNASGAFGLYKCSINQSNQSIKSIHFVSVILFYYNLFNVICLCLAGDDSKTTTPGNNTLVRINLVWCSSQLSWNENSFLITNTGFLLLQILLMYIEVQPFACMCMYMFRSTQNWLSFIHHYIFFQLVGPTQCETFLHKVFFKLIAYTPSKHITKL
jgi:hypothetical protein